MKVMLVNGSSHLHGTTMTALEEMIKVFHSEEVETEVVQLGGKPIADCLQCNVCQKTGKCVIKDDGVNEFVEKAKIADGFVFATPVYWWGMSAQLKQVIDKCYCRGMQLKGKKAGVIVAGGSPVDNIQYELIRKQFECMAGYLSWDMLFQKSYYATDRDELAKNTAAIEELEDLGKKIG